MKKLQVLLMTIVFLTLVGCTQETETPIIIPEVDTQSPIISIIGDEEVFHVLNRTYIDQGATISDNVDTKESMELVVSGDTVDVSELGTYTINYDTFDTSGNIASQVTRTIHVVYKEPGMTVSFSYESYDKIGMFVQVYDLDNVLIGLEAYLYLDDEVINTVTIEGGMQSFEFENLQSGLDYELFVEGTYNLGGDQGVKEFTSNPINVGTYRKLDNDLREDYPSDEVFDAIQDLVYLPYNNSEDVIIERIVFELTKVDPELLVGVANETSEKIILTDGTITSVYDYFFLKGEDARGTGGTFDTVSGVCCGPIVVRFTGGSVAEQVLLHEFGHSVDFMLFNGLSSSEEFQTIWELEKDVIFTNSSYYLDYPEEYFAESFAYYYQGETTRDQLLALAPLTYAYMESLVDMYDMRYPEH